MLKVGIHLGNLPPDTPKGMVSSTEPGLVTVSTGKAPGSHDEENVECVVMTSSLGLGIPTRTGMIDLGTCLCFKDSDGVSG